NGTPVVNFYIASNRKFKDNTGQWRENVCFVGVVAWHKLAESCFEFLTKGSAVLIEGELQSRCWKNDDGSNNNVVEIKARRIQFLNRLAKKDESLILNENDTIETFEVDADNPETPVLEDSESFNEREQKHDEPDASEFTFSYKDLKF
ncbi:MAG: single-stranded DNA-binding protein, partial [bacterium]